MLAVKFYTLFIPEKLFTTWLKTSAILTAILISYSSLIVYRNLVMYVLFEFFLFSNKKIRLIIAKFSGSIHLV